MLVISVDLRAAYDPLMGTWKLNLENASWQGGTTYSPGYPVPRSRTCRFEASGAGGVKFISDTVAADGKLRHVEYTVQLDDKDYPVKGDLNSDTVALKRIKPFITAGTSKKAGKVTSTFSVMIWGNGMIMTIRSKETRNGETYENVELYNRVIQ